MAPDGYTTILSLINTLPLALTVIQVVFILIALWCTYTAFTDLAVTAAAGQKYFASNRQPTVGGSFVKMILAGVLFVTADQLFAVGVASSVFGDASVLESGLVSLQSYQSNVQNDQLKAGLVLIIMFCQVVGVTAVLYGVKVFINISDGTSEHSLGRAFAWVIFGALCFQIQFVHALLGNILGWNLGSLFTT